MIQLDSQQRKAVMTETDRALVLAGAGSGKTRVLIERIAHLVEKKKVSPYEICAFTFTRKAAGEMKERLEDRIPNQAYKVTMGTMHALGLKMLKRMGELIGLRNREITVYSEWEEIYLLRQVAMETAYYRKKKWDPPKKQIDEMFNHYYQTGEEPLENHVGHNLFRAFFNRCRENNALTYGGLLIGLKILIPHLAKYFNWRHILVDEVQDIDSLQWRIIGLLCEAFEANLYIVGDIDQSIYEWRGAVPQNLRKHAHEFDIYRIERNYRSDAHVVIAANRLIKNNQDRLEKTMIPFEDPQTHILYLNDMDSKCIVGLITALKNKSPNGHRAVLARNHVLLKKLSNLLKEAGIEHNYIGKKTALTNSEDFRRFHAFLKLIVNPYDNFAFLLIKDILGVSHETYHRIRLEAAEKGWSHFETWVTTGKMIGDDWQDFFKDADDYMFIAQLNYLNELLNDKFKYDETMNFACDWHFRNPVSFVGDYLDWLSTYDIQDEMTEEKEILQLMTIHAAKGLEWPTVVIAGANEGLIPSKQAIAKDDIEAERRLMYVAVTRAEDQLIITIRPEAKASESGKVYINPISRFVEEMSE